MNTTEKRRVIVVTGGNTGIGYALCKLLMTEDNCFVYLGSRSIERG
jgi:NAD(P)-dependent dehydrogenase (short-subunit alcohol dehydrogenase family)